MSDSLKQNQMAGDHSTNVQAQTVEIHQTSLTVSEAHQIALGTRLGELSKVEWSEVDLDRNEITLKRYNTKGKEPGTLPIYGGWQKSSETNSIPIAHGSSIARERRFTSGTGPVEALGVPELHFHVLRRTPATNMIDAGFSEKEAIAITGQKTD